MSGILDEITLSHMFTPKYMNIELSNRLASVSRVFNEFSHKYTRQVEFVDLKYDLESCFDKDKMLCHVSDHCKNVLSVKNIDTISDLTPNKTFDWTGWISNFTRVKHLHFRHFSICEAGLMGLLNLPKLNSLDFDGAVVERESDFDFEKFVKNSDLHRRLRLTRLCIYSTHLVSFLTMCQLNELKYLELTPGRLKDEEIDRLCECLSHCVNIRHLTLKTVLDQVPKYFRLRDSLPHQSAVCAMEAFGSLAKDERLFFISNATNWNLTKLSLTFLVSSRVSQRIGLKNCIQSNVFCRISEKVDQPVRKKVEIKNYFLKTSFSHIKSVFFLWKRCMKQNIKKVTFEVIFHCKVSKKFKNTLIKTNFGGHKFELGD